MQDSQLDDARASDPVERLLEESWESRDAPRQPPRAGRGGLPRPCCSWLLPARSRRRRWRRTAVDAWLALLLVGLYALVATAVRFPLGAGYVVPTYVILVPMLLLLPPSTVPLLTAAALVLGSVARWTARRVSVDHVLFSIPNAWHAVGPAFVLMLAGTPHGVGESIAVYLGAFLAGCIFDLASSTLRESFALAVTPTLQLRVVAVVWLIDGCVAPLGLLLGHAARHDHVLLLMMLPVSALLVLLERDRSARIAQAQHRLELVARERTRLQGAVQRLGDAFAAKLDLPVAVEHRPATARSRRSTPTAASSRSTWATVPRWSRRPATTSLGRAARRRPHARAALGASPQQVRARGSLGAGGPAGPGGEGAPAAAR